MARGEAAAAAERAAEAVQLGKAGGRREPAPELVGGRGRAGPGGRRELWARLGLRGDRGGGLSISACCYVGAARVAGRCVACRHARVTRLESMVPAGIKMTRRQPPAATHRNAGEPRWPPQHLPAAARPRRPRLRAAAARAAAASPSARRPQRAVCQVRLLHCGVERTLADRAERAPLRRDPLVLGCVQGAAQRAAVGLLPQRARQRRAWGFGGGGRRRATFGVCVRALFARASAGRAAGRACRSLSHRLQKRGGPPVRMTPILRMPLRSGTHPLAATSTRLGRAALPAPQALQRSASLAG